MKKILVINGANLNMVGIRKGRIRRKDLLRSDNVYKKIRERTRT